MKHFVDAVGDYIGAFNDGNSLIPVDAIEVPTQPVDGMDKWVAGAWVRYYPPVVVTPWQIRKALNASGLRAAVEAAVAASDQQTKDAWEFAQEFRRDNPLIAAVAGAMGKTDGEIDALFALAVSL